MIVGCFWFLGIEYRGGWQVTSFMVRMIRERMCIR